MLDTFLLGKSSNSKNCWFAGCNGSICNTIVDTLLLLWENSMGSDKKTRLQAQQECSTIRCFSNGKKKHIEDISDCCNLFCHLLVK